MRQIVQRQVDKIQGILASNSGKNDGFLSGKLGLSFYYYHTHLVFEERQFADKAELLLREVFDQINSGNPRIAGSALSNGGAGLGYVVNFMKRERFIDFEV